MNTTDFTATYAPPVTMTVDVDDRRAIYNFSGPTLRECATLRIEYRPLRFGKSEPPEVTINHSGCGSLTLTRSLEFAACLVAAQQVAARFLANPIIPEAN